MVAKDIVREGTPDRVESASGGGNRWEKMKVTVTKKGKCCGQEYYACTAEFWMTPEDVESASSKELREAVKVFERRRAARVEIGRRETGPTVMDPIERKAE